MGLVSATEMLKKAKAGHYGVGQFNINNLEWTKSILLEAQELNAPVILGVSEGAAKYMTGFTTVAAVVGLKNTTTGDTLCDENHPIILESMKFPEPVIRVAIEPKTKAGNEKMGIALAKLAEEDPTFKTYTDEETGQTIIAGMGELHLEIIVDRLLREFKVEANVGAPQVAYRETIRKEANQETKYARQSGGKGQYGHVKIKIEPNEPGKGLRVRQRYRWRRYPEGIHPCYRQRYSGCYEVRRSGRLSCC